MNKNNIWQLLINPFTRIAGWQALFAGIIFIAITAFISTYSGAYFDGVIDFHYGKDITFLTSIFILKIDILSITFCMWIAGLLISKKFRIIDILGTMALAKAPMIILAIAAYFATAPELNKILQNPQTLLSDAGFVTLIILTIPVTIWSVTLMYQGFKISIGAKGSKLTIAFIVSLFIAEVISKVLIHYLT